MSKSKQEFQPGEDVAYVIMHRLTWRNPEMPDSRVVVANCGHKAWQAPTSTAFLADDPVGMGAYTVCTSCVSPEFLAEILDDGYLAAVPGSAQEFADAVGRSTADQVMAYLRDLGIREWSS
jgi:hypothetical protein